MKFISNFLSASLLLSVATFTFSCEEKGPDIDFTVPETDRVILVEEFTGVKCVNCPDGHRKLEELEHLYNGKVLSLSIHTGFYAKPYPESKSEYKTPQGENIEQILGTATAYPSAAVNRVHFEEETDLIINLAKWAGKIATEIAEPSKVNISLENSSYNPASRTVSIVAEVQFVEEVDYTTVLNVALTEDSIIDLQLDTFGVDSNYVHMNVFRDLLSADDGDVMDADAALGIVEYKYSYTLPAYIDEKHFAITAYISNETSSANKDVLQATRWHAE